MKGEPARGLLYDCTGLRGAGPAQPGSKYPFEPYSEHISDADMGMNDACCEEFCCSSSVIAI
jgi:hypothetical protein